MDDLGKNVLSFFEMMGVVNKQNKAKMGKMPRMAKQVSKVSKQSVQKVEALSHRQPFSKVPVSAKTRTAEQPVRAATEVKVQQQSNNVSAERVRPSPRPGTANLANVFAPRLLPVSGAASAVAASTSHDHNWLSIKEMIEQGFHCAVYLIHCPLHKKVAVSKPTPCQAMWMPFTPIPPNRSWEEAGQTGLLFILSGGNVELSLRLDERHPYTERSLIEVHDVQLPQSLEIMKRLTWYVRLDQKVTGFKCCENSDTLQWIGVADIIEQNSAVLEYLWGTELVELTNIVSHCLREKKSLFTSFNELSLESAFRFMLRSQTGGGGTPEAKKPSSSGAQASSKDSSRNSPAGGELKLLTSAHLSETDIERLYSDFLEHCHPSVAMALHSFKVFLTKYGLRYTDDRMLAFFRAFNSSNSGAITFSELLIGLACIDSSSIHNEVRTAFVLRYYDVYHRGYLTEDDLRLMLQDIHAQEKGGVTEESIETELRNLWKEVRPEKEEKTGKNIIRQRRFLAAVGSHKIRGTSKLCRLGKSICAAISSAIFMRAQRSANQEKKLVSVIELPYQGTCGGCRAKKPQLEETVHRLTSDGYSDKVEKHFALIIETAESASISSSEGFKRESAVKASTSKGGAGGKGGGGKRGHRKKFSHVKSNRSQKSQASSIADLNTLSSMSSVEGVGESTMPSSVVTSTKELDEAKEVALRLLRQLRIFAKAKGTTDNPKGFLGKSEAARFLEHLEQLENALAPILSKSRVVEVVSPVYVVGDIHGNLSDLLSLEHSLWKRFPLVGPNLLFLGDIVDRGKWSVECATYIFCLIVIAPEKVTMLRGNHEIRAIQSTYSYHRECLSKYGDEVGEKIWQLTNRIFDTLPLCAIIDGAVFCAHGGIPRSATTLEEIAASLPPSIPEPMTESQVAWEILWSDPMSQPQFIDTARTMQLDVSQCGGFLPNRKRGTAWAFGEEAVDRFLAANGLSHIIRAHEVPPNGFSFLFSAKCATVFSCSHYCKNQNDAAVLFVFGDVIRPIRIDTSNNESATD